MSTSDQRFEEVKTNYINALLNERDDIARAATPSDVSAIQANAAQAGAIFYQTAADKLGSTDPLAEQAYQAAVAANKAVVAARQSAATIPQLLTKLADATDAATGLVKKAAS